jgi:hypothetical protein
MRVALAAWQAGPRPTVPDLASWLLLPSGGRRRRRRAGPPHQLDSGVGAGFWLYEVCMYVYGKS